MRKLFYGKHFHSRAATLAASLGAVLAGCTGPVTVVDNPDGHRVFVDGREDRRADLPFRYYGTTQVDALPKDRRGRTDFALQPARFAVAVPPPASPWLFPFDFPVELARWAFHTPTPAVARIELPPTDPEQRISPDFRPTGLELVNERALQARISR